jgi:hypothetical protein
LPKFLIDQLLLLDLHHLHGLVEMRDCKTRANLPSKNITYVQSPTSSIYCSDDFYILPGQCNPNRSDRRAGAPVSPFRYNPFTSKQSPAAEVHTERIDFFAQLHLQKKDNAFCTLPWSADHLYLSPMTLGNLVTD